MKIAEQDFSLHVAHIVDGRCSRDSANGVDRSIWHFAKYQALLGCEVTVVCLTSKVVAPIPGVKVISIKRPAFPLILNGALQDTIASLSPDLIHLHGAYVPINVTSARVAKKLNIPYVFTPHGNYSPILLRRRFWLKRPYQYLFELGVGNGAAFIHAINDHRDIRRYGVDRPIVEAVNGVEAPENVESTPERKVYADLGIPESARILMFLGRLDIGQKGLDMLVRGFGRAAANCPNLYLVLVGPDWQKSSQLLKTIANASGHGDRVIFAGGKFGEEKIALIRDCDFFLHPSRWEAGVPFSVLEALAYGRPTLVSKASDPRGLVAKNNAGFSSKVSAEALAKAVEKIDGLTAEQLAELGVQARELVAEEFSWEQSARKLVGGYRQYLNTD